MKRNIFFAALIFMTAFCQAKDYQKEVTDCIVAGKFDEAEKTMKQWQTEESSSIEMKIGWFNFYMHRNASETTTMGRLDDGRYGVYPKTIYDPADVKTAVSWLDQILETNPERLDVWCGKCSALLRTENLSQACETVLELLEESRQNENNWTWSNNVSIPKDEGKQKLVSSVNDYYRTMYNPFAQNADYIRQIIEKEMELYPDEIWFINHAARYYRDIQNFDKAAVLLEHAAELSPDDYIVIGNLAYTYELKGDYKNARRWYTYMLDMDEQEAKDYGKQGLEIIRGKN